MIVAETNLTKVYLLHFFNFLYLGCSRCVSRTTERDCSNK